MPMLVQESLAFQSPAGRVHYCISLLRFNVTARSNPATLSGKANISLSQPPAVLVVQDTARNDSRRCAFRKSSSALWANHV